MALRTLSICTGGTAGLELGLRIACRTTTPICYVEIEKASCETLVTRFEDGSLDPAPIWSDLATFDGSRLRGLVDAVSAGLPCQPYSIAGKRKGHSDERAIWTEFIRVVREVLPPLVFLENVPEFLKHFRPIGDELQGLGYTVTEPLLIAASDVGASHKRLRVFILAYRNVGRREEPRLSVRSGQSRKTEIRTGRRGEELADARSSGGDGVQPIPEPERRETPVTRRDSEELALSEIGRRGELWESSEIRIGFAHGDNESVEDSSRNGECRSDGKGGIGRGVPQTGHALANSRRAGNDGRTEEPSGIGRPRSSDDDRRTSGELGDSARSIGQGFGTVPDRRQDRSSDAGSILAEPSIEGSPIWRNDSGLRELAATERTGNELAANERIFSLDLAPGPFAFSPDNSGWQEILAKAPYLNPAVEPGFRCMVNGSPFLVDLSRTDQLRSLGNGVVPLQAAIAFTLLVREAGINFEEYGGLVIDG